MIALEDIGREIARARKARRLRQADLAAQAHISRATVDALENGRATDIGYSRLARILAALSLEMRVGPVASRRPTLDELLKERADDA